MWELCLKRADSDHYGYPERGLKFLVHKGVPKVLNYLERKPKLLMVSKAEVLNLVFITLRPLWINESLEMEESAHVHLCAQGEALSHILDFKMFMTADQMICRSEAIKDCFWVPPACKTFRNSPSTPALASVWGKTHHGSLTLRQEHVTDSHSYPEQNNKQIASQLTPSSASRPACPRQPSQPDLPEFGHTQDLHSLRAPEGRV